MMSVLEYAEDVSRSVDDILNICKILDISVGKEDDMLSDDDIILLDINMPQMDGFEVLQALNEKQYIKEIPVVVISTENDVAFVRRAYELGATDYISRPFNAIVIHHRVKNTLMIYSNQKNWLN